METHELVTLILEHLIEWREHLRASHVAAGNCGAWPHNGSIRVAAEKSCAAMAVEADPDWASIVEGADPAEYAKD